jgi:hypothetical protein
MVVGCSPVPVPENIVPLANAGRAQAVAAAFLGGGETPPVFGVPPDLICVYDVPDGTVQGFVSPETGLCVGGLTYPDNAIFIVVYPGARYSDLLCHETLHWLTYDLKHAARATWGPGYGGADDDLVPRCNATLVDALGDDDEIRTVR